MYTFYQKLIERLSQINELRYIDLNAGQLEIEQPPLAYPAVLIQLSETREDVDHAFQIVTGRAELTIVGKYYSETHQRAPKSVRQNGLAYMKLTGKVHDALQGYQDDTFEPFDHQRSEDRQMRAGLKTIVQTWETAWKANTHSAN